ncbi:hypothetical protein GZ77_01810 [Endozoicomonas montiporae]|uniref:Uncharacterized protein n=1 Tax=Endozoicomonas montiporae TaxID=1027273 RepID=A0A081NAD5_9GAMM|nr:hypothetical protein [Endozoicomonas montiporae]KEQ15408.1 hypothetical protein GZ77_01810 [Endozoicomonas montiporae]
MVLPFYAVFQLQSPDAQAFQKEERFVRARELLKKRFEQLVDSGAVSSATNAELVSRMLLGLALHTALTEQTLQGLSAGPVTGRQLAETLGIHG